MDLLTRIISCNDEELDQIISNELNKIIEASEQKERLGFGSNGETFGIHKGFIHPNTRIRYTNMTAFTYSMKTIDFYYGFAKYLKQRNIQNKGTLIKYLQNFINEYFGVSKTEGDNRDDFLFSLTLGATANDDEAWDKIEKLEIGDFKRKKVAMCTEKASLAQNVLSLFGIESYWCMGYVNNNGKIEPHCFNIARAKDNYILLDYSIPCAVIHSNRVADWAPFQGKIEILELEQILEGKNQEFTNYEYIISNNNLQITSDNTKRIYTVDNYTLNRNKKR